MHKGQSETRRKQRSNLHKERFYGESKNTHLTVGKQFKYARRKQLIVTEQGTKTIMHYDLCK